MAALRGKPPLGRPTQKVRASSGKVGIILDTRRDCYDVSHSRRLIFRTDVSASMLPSITAGLKIFC